jgi:glycine betaine/proline transport system substrate-binding protein
MPPERRGVKLTPPTAFVVPAARYFPFFSPSWPSRPPTAERHAADTDAHDPQLPKRAFLGCGLDRRHLHDGAGRPAAALHRLHARRITVLSVPVTFASIKNKDIDVFLGNWMPAQEADRKPYDRRRLGRRRRSNLTGAKYTLAVPAYTYDAGLKDFNDISASRPQLNNSIYGIEPGNDGNRLCLACSSRHLRPGRLQAGRVERAGHAGAGRARLPRQKPIVFLAWEPHPMNMRFDLKLPLRRRCGVRAELRRATIYTVTRKGYSAECPNVGGCCQPQIHAARRERNDGGILDRHEQPEVAAAEWLKANPTDHQGLARRSADLRRPAGAAPGARGAAAASRRASSNGSSSHKIPVGDAMAVAIDYVKTHGTFLFDGISIVIRGMVDGVTACCARCPRRC